jgi:hypothetical protein
MFILFKNKKKKFLIPMDVDDAKDELMSWDTKGKIR